MADKRESFASEVAQHYNKIEQKSVKERKKSDIIELRTFNNAMKSLMLSLAFKYSEYCRKRGEGFRLLDLGCGKGGDLLKYRDGDRVDLVVGVDIADVSIEQCKERYDALKRNHNRLYKGHFFVADLTRVNIEKKLHELVGDDRKFHIASSQFSIHYSFESFDQAVMYIKNAANNLMKFGVFVGTYPDGPKLVRMARESKTPGHFQIGDILSVRFSPEDLANPQPFGTKFHFKLQEVVDCPEFILHPEVLRKLMTSLGFYEIFDRSFEQNITDVVSNQNDVVHIRKIFTSYFRNRLGDEPSSKPAIDDDMWKVASLYRCFCYKKIRDD